MQASLRSMRTWGPAPLTASLAGAHAQSHTCRCEQVVFGFRKKLMHGGAVISAAACALGSAMCASMYWVRSAVFWTSAGGAASPQIQKESVPQRRQQLSTSWRQRARWSLCLRTDPFACALSCVPFQGCTLTTAWVGDSRMVLGRQKKKGWRSTWEAIDLSTDHKPTTPEERNQILDNHGRVERCALRLGFLHSSTGSKKPHAAAPVHTRRRALCKVAAAAGTNTAAGQCHSTPCAGQGYSVEPHVLIALELWLSVCCSAGLLTRLASPWVPTVCGWSTHGCQGSP